MAWEEIGVGTVLDTLVTPFGEQLSVPQRKLQVRVGHGAQGDCHAGLRLADSRETLLNSLGIGPDVVIANVRELTIVTQAELSDISLSMQTPAPVGPAALGANLLIDGMRASDWPLGTMLTFAGHRGGRPRQSKAVLAVWDQNRPCEIPHNNIVDMFGGAGAFQPAVPFGQAAKDRRGVVAFVYSSGTIKPGHTVTAWCRT